MTASDSDTDEAYERSIELLRRALTSYGFLASIVDVHNYRRVWARDGVIAGLAALASEESDLVEGMRRTLITLAGSQGPHGEIPSNVDPERGEVSYGSVVGRVDPPLWFLFGIGRYVRITGDAALAEVLRTAADRTVFLLGSWEMNNRGLIYVPLGGDWADEYPLSGYNLFDQVLYYRALSEYAAVYGNDEAAEKAEHLKGVLEANFLPTAELAGDRMRRAGRGDEGGFTSGPPEPFYLASFSPAGYPTVFDGFGNALALLSEVGPTEVRSEIASMIDHLAERLPLRLLPAFFPPIQEGDSDWDSLTHCYRFEFRNQPFEYHNGGLWPMITGFYACALVRQGNLRGAERYLDAIHAANRLGREGAEWGFSEYLNGKDGEPRGTVLQTWSAAGAVLAQNAIRSGEPVL